MKEVRYGANGNTRTTAVFFIKCLCTLGFDVTNDILPRTHGIFGIRWSGHRKSFSQISVINLINSAEHVQIFCGCKNRKHPVPKFYKSGEAQQKYAQDSAAGAASKDGEIYCLLKRKRGAKAIVMCSGFSDEKICVNFT